MKIVLITGIGGDIAQSIATVIKETLPKVRIIGVDMNSEHAGHLLIDEFFQVPEAASDDYINHIKILLNACAVDVIIPTSEQELSVFTPLINELGEDRCITLGEKIIDIGTDKLKTMDFIASLNIPVPWSVSAKNELPTTFPCIFKAQTGSGSKNIFKVDNNKEAAFLAKKFSHSIFQELLEPEDQEITCAIYRTRDGRVSVLQLLRKLAAGITVYAKVIYNKDIFKMCKIIANGIDLRGSINIQLIITNSGPKIFEINSRFSSTVLMRHRLGFCDLIWMIDEAEGRVVNFPDIAIDQVIVRTYNAKTINNKQ
jgi:carbamoyl-phosphate synthase large subunit